MKTALQITILYFSLIILVTTPALSQTTVYTDEVIFFEALNPNQYTENFESLPAYTPVTTPTNFGGKGFSFTAETPPDGDNTLYSLPDTASPTGRWLTTLLPGEPLIFTKISPGTSALGGNLFTTDLSGNFGITPIELIMEFSNGSSTNIVFTPITVSSFFGVTVGNNLSITSLTIISSLNSEFPTANNLTMGGIPQPVPIVITETSYAGSGSDFMINFTAAAETLYTVLVSPDLGLPFRPIEGLATTTDSDGVGAVTVPSASLGTNQSFLKVTGGVVQ